MTIVIAIAAIVFFAVLGSQQRKAIRDGQPPRPLPRAQVREKP